MPDREKVIKGFEECMGEGRCTKCVYGKETAMISCKELLWDALALLKEQEAVKPTILDYPSGRRRAWCGKCGYRVKIGYHGDCTENFCGKCGTPILWEGR